MRAIGRILVATDFSGASQTAVRYGRELARQFGAQLTVLHVVADPAAMFGGTEMPIPGLDELREEAVAAVTGCLEATLTRADRRDGATTALVLSARPAHAIVEYATEHGMDLIVTGTHGRTGLAHFFVGSVAEEVVRSAGCPVMTVRQTARGVVQPDALRASAAGA
jgi:nucleotide-binding universal stress UspA family protein